MGGFFNELRRRNVFRVAAMYLVVCWLTMQVIAVMTPALKLPDWVDSFLAVLFIAGFPISMLIAWAFEITPSGIAKTESVPVEQSMRELTGRRMDLIVFLGLMLVGGLIVFDRFIPSKPEDLSTLPRSGVVEQAAPGALTGDATIAVLPFIDISQTQDQKYFSDGIAEEILNLLVRVEDLKVIGRSLSFSFGDERERLSQLGQQYNISHYLDGSVRREGESVRISVALIDAVSGVQNWSQTYTDDLEGIFDLQEEIAKSVAGELKVILDVEGERELAESITRNPESYDLFLRGRNLYRFSFTETEILEALALIERAVELDPEFAEAWAVLGQAYLAAPSLAGHLDPNEYFEKAEQASQEAIRLNPGLSYAYATIGSIQSIRGNPAQAMKTLEIGYDLDPNDSMIMANMGLIYLVTGLPEKAEGILDKMVAIDPDRPAFLSYVALAKRGVGKLKESDFYAQKSADTGYFIAYDTLAWNAYQRGDNQDAIDQLLKMHETGGDQLAPDFQARSLWEAGGRAYYQDSERDREFLRSLFDVYLQSENAQINGMLVTILSRLGLHDAYFKHANQPLSSSSWAMATMWDRAPYAQALRRNPGFPDFVKSLGFVEFWEAYGWPDACQKSGSEITCE